MSIYHDLLVPGTPNVRFNGHPTLAGIRDATGSASPTTHEVTLNGSAVARYVVRRVDPVALPMLTAPLAPAGTRDVVLNNANQSIGDFATLRNLTLNGGAGMRAIPPGAYGEFTANGGSGLQLGVAGATTPAIYHLRRLTLNGSATLQVVGPVRLNLGNTLIVNATAGAAANPR